jgi:hypothetical protein
MSKGVELIAAERQRQVEEEGYTTEHDDDNHKRGEIVAAACHYAAPDYCPYPVTWPILMGKFREDKPRLRQLVIAGALIAAEIDRLLRQEARAAEIDRQLDIKDAMSDLVILK